jgi:hypothetical protein
MHAGAWLGAGRLHHDPPLGSGRAIPTPRRTGARTSSRHRPLDRGRQRVRADAVARGALDLIRRPAGPRLDTLAPYRRDRDRAESHKGLDLELHQLAYADCTRW